MTTTKSINIKKSYWSLCVALILLQSLYWFFFATKRYVSESVFSIESASVSTGTVSIGSLFNGSANIKDLLFLKEYIMSFDMLEDLERELKITTHYSNPRIDYFSRLKKSHSKKEALEYYENRVNIIVDDYTGVMRLSVEAFSPEMSQKISELLLKNGELHINNMSRNLAKEQVDFTEEQVSELSKQVQNHRKELISFQDINGHISPEMKAQSISEIIFGLERKLIETETEKSSLESYLSSDSVQILKIEESISTIKKQINHQKSRLVGEKKYNSLNKVSDQYKEIQTRLNLSIDLYESSLLALEKTRIDSIRKLKKISILQTPSYSKDPEKPNRAYQALSYGLSIFILFLIAALIYTVISEHRD